MISMNPKNPNQLSVERENEDTISVSVVRSERFIPDSPDTVVVGITVGATCPTSSITNNEIMSMSHPSPVMIHFQIHFLTIPGSSRPRMSPIAGKR